MDDFWFGTGTGTAYIVRRYSHSIHAQVLVSMLVATLASCTPHVNKYVLSVQKTSCMCVFIGQEFILRFMPKP